MFQYEKELENQRASDKETDNHLVEDSKIEATVQEIISKSTATTRNLDCLSPLVHEANSERKFESRVKNEISSLQNKLKTDFAKEINNIEVNMVDFSSIL